VPDRAEIGIDIRTIPGQDLDGLREALRSTLGSDVDLLVTVEAPSVWTDPDDPFVREVFAVCRDMGHAPVVEAAPYFTDASALTPALGNVPTVILGPGPAHMAHQTDEWCDLDKIDEAVAIYERLIARWCGL
jgi:succinyl-diaminopimelate desuccinylase